MSRLDLSRFKLMRSKRKRTHNIFSFLVARIIRWEMKVSEQTPVAGKSMASGDLQVWVVVHIASNHMFLVDIVKRTPSLIDFLAFTNLKHIEQDFWIACAADRLYSWDCWFALCEFVVCVSSFRLRLLSSLFSSSFYQSGVIPNHHHTLPVELQRKCLIRTPVNRFTLQDFSCDS